MASKGTVKKSSVGEDIRIQTLLLIILLIIFGLSVHEYGDDLNQWRLQRAVDIQWDDLLFEDYRVQYLMGDFYDKHITVNTTELDREMNSDPDSDGFRRTKIVR